MEDISNETFNGFFRFGTNGTLILVLATALFLSCYSHIKLWAKYSGIPGPTPLPFIGNLLEFLAYEIDALRTVSSITKRYNGFAKIWLGRVPMLLISNPEHLQIFYTNPTMLDKADQYGHLADVLGKESIFCAKTERWKKVRKMMIMSFHPTPNEIFLKNFQIAQKDLTQALLDKADGSTFPCQFIVKTMLLTSIFLNTTGYEIPKKHALDFLTAADYVQRFCYLRQVSLLLRNDWIFYVLPSGRQFQKYVNYGRTFIAELVEEKRMEMQRMTDNGEPIPNLYIYNMFRKFGNEPQDVITAEFMNLIVTGMDTTANSICFTLLICGLFPEIQERIYKEDQEVMKSLAGNKLAVADLEKYEFLDRVIKETLRLFPIGPIVARKLGEDTFFGDVLVPKGTDVAAVPYVTYLDPDLFPDPLKFDPDRFLPENVEKRHPFAYNPFSAGSRGCPGNRYGVIGLKTIVSAIVRDFVIKTHYNSLEELMANSRAEVTLNDKQEFPIRVLPRSRK